jgi:hypothetical protein
MQSPFTKIAANCVLQDAITKLFDSIASKFLKVARVALVTNSKQRPNLS